MNREWLLNGLLALLLVVVGWMGCAPAHAQTVGGSDIDTMSVPGMILVGSCVFSWFHGFKTGFKV